MNNRLVLRLSNRALFLWALLVGLIGGVPGWAIAKGQWCNGELIRHKVALTVQAVTVGGVAATAPDGGVYDLTSGTSSDDVISGHLHCPDCTGQVASRDNLMRQP